MSFIAATASFTPGDRKRALDVGVLVRMFAAVQRSQNIVAEEAQRIVAVDTGELRDSIAPGKIDDDGHRITGTVSATADHAAYVEFGTGLRGAGSPGAGPVAYSPTWPGMVAQPYLRPALDSARDRVLKEFQG